MSSRKSLPPSSLYVRAFKQLVLDIVIWRTKFTTKAPTIFTLPNADKVNQM